MSLPAANLTNFNDTHTWKICFTQFSTRMAAWLLLIFSICLHNQLSSLHSVTRIKQYRCLKDVIHQIDSKNEWLLLSFSIGKHFFLEFSF